MERTFTYTFAPTRRDPVGGHTVKLSTEAIEGAGICEVLQTPGASFGSWSVLDALLEPTGAGTPFVFKEALGQAREVKVALSGLFGRFVARAYLERYFGLALFAHVTSGSILLKRGRRIHVVRRKRGDLPDWLASSGSRKSLAIVEAKGCHDVPGTARAMKRAWPQTHRIDVMAGRKKVSVKRIAIVTRWGVRVGGAHDPLLSVHDPRYAGAATPEDEDATIIELLRVHIANLITRLGHSELAAALLALSAGTTEGSSAESSMHARKVVDTSAVREIAGSDAPSANAELIGGFISRSGPLGIDSVEAGEQEVLARLGLRPMFVGVDRSLIHAAIDGEIEAIRGALVRDPRQVPFARRDRAGGWIVPVGSGVNVL